MARFSALDALKRQGEVTKLLSMIFLFFLVVFAIGVLRPVRNAFALDGLADTDFYKVYFVSAVVVLFVPIYNRLADRIRWKVLIPAVALFFASNLVVFRLLYREGSTAFGMALYGWYDLFAAGLVTQFFIATQLFFNTRDAKRAYPLVIAGGSIGATLGGAITGFFAQRVGTANLLLVAAGSIVLFAVSLALVWARENPDEGRTRGRSEDDESLSVGEFRRIFRNPHVQLIAATVLLTVLVKQLVDYEYNTLTKQVFRDVDAISAFQGKFYAATQWLPILVLATLRPILTRWGVGVAVLIFPVAMLLTTAGLALFFSLAAAVAAKGADTTFRYSAERTGREVLYVPVPDEIKLKAKAYIDVAMEKGVGKVASALLLLLLLSIMSIRHVALVAMGLAVVLALAAGTLRREYVKSLAKSFEGRFTGLRGTFVSLADTGALELARQGLADPRKVKIAFTLDLLSQAEAEEVAELAPQLHDLLGHESPEIRTRALWLLTRAPAAIDPARVRSRLEDESQAVREAAVRAIAVTREEDLAAALGAFLASDDARVRAAALAGLGRDVPSETAAPVVTPHFERLRESAKGEDAARRLELATAAGLVPDHAEVAAIVRALMTDDDPAVARAAMASAGRLPHEALIPDLIEALGSSRTREAARRALVQRGASALGALITTLNDVDADLWVRRGAAAVLGDLPSEAAVNALITSYLLPETEQALDDRTLASLNRLRASNGDLEFPLPRILEAMEREVDGARRYGEAADALGELDRTRTGPLLGRALREAGEDRRAAAFRWLGLVFPQERMYRSHMAVAGGPDRTRANALEWIESTVGREIYQRLRPVLDPKPSRGSRPLQPADLLRGLWDDEDVWIARCALWTAFENDAEGTRKELSGFAPAHPGLGRTITAIAAGADGEAPRRHPAASEGDGMDLIEKVFLLQDVDLLSGVRSQQLSLLGSIAREIEADADRVLIKKGDPTDAMYVVITGQVSLEGMGQQSIALGEGQAFGTWALIDEQPSLVEARAVRPTRLLRILRVDFRDLLVDHPELGLDLLQGLARRVRSLATA